MEWRCYLSGSGGSTASADTTDKDVDLALGLVPDLRASCLSVMGGVEVHNISTNNVNTAQRQSIQR